MALFTTKKDKEKQKKRQTDIATKVADIQRPPSQVRAKTGFTVGGPRDVMYQQYATPSKENVATRASMVKPSPVPKAAKEALAKAKKKKAK